MNDSLGTLNYLQGFKKRRGQGNSEESNETTTLQPVEPKITDITNLTQATEFIRKSEKDTANSMFKLAHGLKKVRDEKLYLEKYDTFEAYFENELEYKRRSVYNFLKLADTYSIDTDAELISIGVRKLLALSGLDEEERNEYIKNNDLINKPAKEVETEIRTIIQQPEEENNENNSNVSGDANKVNEPLVVSISSSELITVKRFYKRMDDLYTSVEKFKDRQQNNLPFEKDDLIAIKEKIAEIEKEKDKLLSLINKYLD